MNRSSGTWWSTMLLRNASVYATIFLSWSAVAQTTGFGPTVLENGPTVNPQRLSQNRYANEFTGVDIGAQVNSAFQDCSYACQVIIPAGTYNSWTTSIVMAAPGQSLIGAGSANTILNYTGSGVGILWQMNPFTITPAGKISGLTISGTASGTAGIHSGSITGAEFEDLEVTGFTGGGAACIWLDNVNGGWTERTVMSRVQMGVGAGCTKDLRLTVTGTGTTSFGYNRWTNVALNVNGSQIGISSESALYFYHSQLALTCNAASTSSVCISITGGSDWDANVYDLVGENQVSGGTAISVASGSQLRGYGVVDFPSMALTNGNGGTYGGTFRILPAPALASQDGGTITSFLGSGVSATVQPTAVDWLDSPEGFGIMNGANIGSPYALMYNWSGRNAFVVGTLNYGQAPSAMTQVARIDTGGNVHAAGAFYANGSDYAESVHVSGKINQYEPGDVLGVDPTSDGRFLKTALPYATNVAGVYSTKPGVLGSSHGLGTAEFQSEVPLAMTGMVPCKVTTENGPIRRGDLLVSSSYPGYAMRGTDRPKMTGAVIGKALEPLETGKGIISILVTLQ
jgi:hypothetical protein